MKLFCINFFLLFVFLSQDTFPKCADKNIQTSILSKNRFAASSYNNKITSGLNTATIGNYHFELNKENERVVVKKPLDGGIKEIIPANFKEKYEKWKDEFLSTEFGRRQWESYLNNKQFKLNITINGEEGQGAGTGNYEWDDAGELVGATITLGKKLDKGLPNPVYFPVMNSLSSEEPKYKINGNLLAAAKLAHEFGHVNQTAKTRAKQFHLQNELILVYNQILLKNGYNVNDRKLIELTEKMGGTPVEIWENREYWGEANAMLFLIDRINKESFYCSVLSKMKRNITTYAKDYEKRFEEIEANRKLISECR